MLIIDDTILPPIPFYSIFKKADGDIEYYLKNTISSVPATIRQNPAKAFFESFSLKTKYEKMTVTMMLSLSMGTTTLTSPFWIA